MLVRLGHQEERSASCVDRESQNRERNETVECRNRHMLRHANQTKVHAAIEPKSSVSPTKWMLSAIGHPQLVRIKAATWVKLLAPIRVPLEMESSADGVDGQPCACAQAAVRS